MNLIEGRYYYRLALVLRRYSFKAFLIPSFFLVREAVDESLFSKLFLLPLLNLDGGFLLLIR
jgi:hypothetical protein|nr:hypothetical protein Q903MT_gene3082 [Picea sitchensis]